MTRLRLLRVLAVVGLLSIPTWILADGDDTSALPFEEGERCFNIAECERSELVASALQSETTIAVDATGQHVVIGFNDFRGFAANPLSVSGVMYSDDGGATFTDAGRLPSPGNQTVGNVRYPQIFGDPDVKYAGGCTFIYTSLGLKAYGAGLAQSLVFHRSTDCGHSWEGPFDIPPTINPNGLVTANGDARDDADKEMTDIDPDTGRYIACWSNFTPVAASGVEISCTYSDDILSATPTFAPRRVIAAGATDGQGSSVRFAGNGSPTVIVAWTRFPSFYTNNVAYSRSTDNGTTWSAPAALGPNFVTMDQVLGNDRVNTNPGVAIDRSSGPFSNNIYVTYSQNNSFDGADVVFQRSTDGGLTFSPRVLINSRPGNDRAQWFPYVTVDQTTGRVIVFYYDQGVATSGHLTEITYTFSDDGGVTWSKPAPLSDRPFKAGWGNDTSQPNLGDYNQAVAQSGVAYFSFAHTRPVGFTDGQPALSMTTPDVSGKTLSLVARPSLRLEVPSLLDTGNNGSLDPGERITIALPVRNYVTNPLNARAVSSIVGTLTSATPNVMVLQGSSSYPSVAPGASAANTASYQIQLDSQFVPGTPIELILTVDSDEGSTALPLTLQTGTPTAAVLLREDFDTVPAGALPAGWVAAHGGGVNTVPWTTSTTFAPDVCGSSNKAFHQNANDVPGATTFARWERLFSPTIVVPPTSDYVTVDFDVCYDTEDDPVLRVLAYDGFFLRVTDLTPGRTLRSVLAEAFEREFTTGGFQHYPKHLPRNSSSAYFEDMSAWAGDSRGVQHVHMKLPGMAASQFQLRFEFAQDQAGICTDVRPGRQCGVTVDNIVVANVVAAAQQPARLVISQTLSRDAHSGEIIAAITITNSGGTTARGIALTSALLGSVAGGPLTTLGDLAPGASAGASVRFPATTGAPGTPTLLRIVATYSEGSVNGTFRVTLP